MRYLVWAVAPMLGLAAFIFYVSVVAPLLLGHQPRPAPNEPVTFSHEVHVEQAGIQCAFCHRTAGTSTTAGMPDLQQCMDCHTVIGQGQPLVEKVRSAWLTQQAIDWQRVYRLPNDVRFTHEAHIQAGISCATCHGDVGHMTQVTMSRPLNMNDCVQCHKVTNAPTECAECHY